MLKFEKKFLGDGASEIGVRSTETKRLIAVITHPMPRAKWFVHHIGNGHRPEKFKTEKAAKESFNNVKK